jgi:ERCC4-type nuclease
MSSSKKRRNVTMDVHDPVLAGVMHVPVAPPPVDAAEWAVTWRLEDKPFGVPIRIKKSGECIPSFIGDEKGCLTIMDAPSPFHPVAGPKQRKCDILIASGESALMARLVLMRLSGAIPPDTVISHAQLICGDIAIVHSTTQEVAWIGERKDKGDFVSSITDGRHRTQQAVMISQNIQKRRICYVIEGNPLKVKRNINPKAIIGSMIYPLVRYGFNTIMTQSTAETALLVGSIHAQLEEADEDKFIAREKISIANTLNSGPKKAALCDADRFSMILTRVPDVSDDVADGIAAVHGSFPKMIGAFRLKDDPELLKDIPVKGKNANRRVGPAASRKIYEYFGVAEILAGESRPAKKQRSSDDDP